MAERIAGASLQSLRAEERKPVEQTFLSLAVFLESITIPMVVTDASAGLDEEQHEEESSSTRKRNLSVAEEWS